MDVSDSALTMASVESGSYSYITIIKCCNLVSKLDEESNLETKISFSAEVRSNLHVA